MLPLQKKNNTIHYVQDIQVNHIAREREDEAQAVERFPFFALKQGGMVVSARFGGTEYIRQISMNEIRHSYAHALMTTRSK